MDHNVIKNKKSKAMLYFEGKGHLPITEREKKVFKKLARPYIEKMIKLQNTCEFCGYKFNYHPHTAQLLKKGQILKVCYECNTKEIAMRLDELKGEIHEK